MFYLVNFVLLALIFAVCWIGGRRVLQERKWGNVILVGGFAIGAGAIALVSYHVDSPTLLLEPRPLDPIMPRAVLGQTAMGATLGGLLALALRSDPIRRLIELLRGEAS